MPQPDRKTSPKDAYTMVPEHRPLHRDDPPEEAVSGEYSGAKPDPTHQVRSAGEQPGSVNAAGSTEKGLGKTVRDKYGQGATAEQSETAGQSGPGSHRKAD